MAVPSSVDAKLFYRAAHQRRQDADVLYAADRTTAAVYRAGYAVECMLNALILAETPRQARGDVLGEFRGARAHDYEWLRYRDLSNGGARFPREITRAFTLVGEWSTELRYWPRSLKHSEAHGFLGSTEAILRWAESRFSP